MLSDSEKNCNNCCNGEGISPYDCEFAEDCKRSPWIVNTDADYWEPRVRENVLKKLADLKR